MIDLFSFGLLKAPAAEWLNPMEKERKHCSIVREGCANVLAHTFQCGLQDQMFGLHYVYSLGGVIAGQVRGGQTGAWIAMPCSRWLDFISYFFLQRPLVQKNLARLSLPSP